MNVNKDVIDYSDSGGKLSYVDKNNGINEDEERFDHYINKDSDGNEIDYNAYNNYTKLSYIKASDSIKAKCVDKEITILDNSGKTNLNKLYINGSEGFITSLDLLKVILSNNLTEQSARDVCRKIGSIIGATSNC